jgi:hypothetical protein
MNVLSKPWMQVRKSQCLLSGSWVGLGNRGVGCEKAIFEKQNSVTLDLKAYKKNV